MSKQRFHLGPDYPREAFVQAAVERHFGELGFITESVGFVDFVASHPDTGERWHVEAKGETSQVGLDFRTGLGQLVQGMTENESLHALAFPATESFIKQSKRVAGWVRVRLQLHWLIVQVNGSIRHVKPSEEIGDL